MHSTFGMARDPQEDSVTSPAATQWDPADVVGNGVGRGVEVGSEVVGLAVGSMVGFDVVAATISQNGSMMAASNWYLIDSAVILRNDVAFKTSANGSFFRKLLENLFDFATISSTVFSVDISSLNNVNL